MAFMINFCELKDYVALWKSWLSLRLYVTLVHVAYRCVVLMWFDVNRRKKRCIRFVADGENEDSGDEADNSTALSSIPLAADSTTEIFSPMPLSSSSSNPDDPLVTGTRPSGGGETESQSSVSSVGVGNVAAQCDDGLSSRSCAVNVPRLSHTASTPSASSAGGSLISSTIVEHWHIINGCKVFRRPTDLFTAASRTLSSIMLSLLYCVVNCCFRIMWSVAVCWLVTETATAFYDSTVRTFRQ